jgi:F-type H+-transporting ATPase subunit c
MKMKKYLLSLATVLVSAPVLAQEGAEVIKGSVRLAHESGSAHYLAVAAGLTIAIAAFGGAMGQGKAAAAALEGIARNPAAKGALFVPMIIGLALIESLVIYALLVAFNLAGKI